MQRVPGAVEEQRAVVDQALQDAGRARKIGQRQQAQTGGDHFPDAQQHDGGGEDRAHVAHPPPQARPERLHRRQHDRRRRERRRERPCRNASRPAARFSRRRDGRRARAPSRPARRAACASASVDAGAASARRVRTASLPRQALAPASFTWQRRHDSLSRRRRSIASRAARDLACPTRIKLGRRAASPDRAAPVRRRLSPLRRFFEPFVRHAVEMHERFLRQARHIRASGSSMPAIFISAAADFTAASPPDTLGHVTQVARSPTVFSSGLEARYFFSTDKRAAAARVGLHPLRALEQRARRRGGGLGIRREPTCRSRSPRSSIRPCKARPSPGRRRCGPCPAASSRLPIGSESATASTSPLSSASPSSPAGKTRHSISLLASMPFAPRTRLAKMNGGVPMPGTPIRLPRRSCDRVDIALHRRLHAQAALVDAGGELHVEPLLDRLEEIHHEVMRDVVTAEREHVLVVRPLALHQFDLEPFLLEEALLDRAEDRRLAGDADVADADFVRARRFGFSAPGDWLLCTRQEQRSRRQAVRGENTAKKSAHGSASNGSSRVCLSCSSSCT